MDQIWTIPVKMEAKLLALSHRRSYGTRLIKVHLIPAFAVMTLLVLEFKGRTDPISYLILWKPDKNFHQHNVLVWSKVSY